MRLTRQQLEELTRQDYLDSAGLERALILAGYRPTLAGWRTFLDYALLTLGTLFTISGIIFFFAYNWNDMSPFLKFGLIEVGIIGAVAFTHYRGLDTLSGQASLISAGMFVGALLAVQGQVYQTGADSYLLFLGWLILISGWIIISQNGVMWLIGLILLNLTLSLYWEQIRDYNDLILPLILILLNGTALLAYEMGQFYGLEWLNTRWLPRLIGTGLFYILISNTNIWLDYQIDGFQFWQTIEPKMVWLIASPLFYVVLTPAAFVAYYYRQDLFMLTVDSFGLVTVISYGIGKVLFDQEFWGNNEIVLSFLLLFMGTIIIIQTGLAITMLRFINRSWEANNESTSS
jgi:uncharacterized membrane protein